MRLLQHLRSEALNFFFHYFALRLQLIYRYVVQLDFFAELLEGFVLRRQTSVVIRLPRQVGNQTIVLLLENADLSVSLLQNLDQLPRALICSIALFRFVVGVLEGPLELEQLFVSLPDDLIQPAAFISQGVRLGFELFEVVAPKGGLLLELHFLFDVAALKSVVLFLELAEF